MSIAQSQASTDYATSNLATSSLIIYTDPYAISAPEGISGFSTELIATTPSSGPLTTSSSPLTISSSPITTSPSPLTTTSKESPTIRPASLAGLITGGIVSTLIIVIALTLAFVRRNRRKRFVTANDIKVKIAQDTAYITGRSGGASHIARRSAISHDRNQDGAGSYQQRNIRASAPPSYRSNPSGYRRHSSSSEIPPLPVYDLSSDEKTSGFPSSSRMSANRPEQQDLTALNCIQAPPTAVLYDHYRLNSPYDVAESVIGTISTALPPYSASGH